MNKIRLDVMPVTRWPKVDPATPQKKMSDTQEALPRMTEKNVDAMEWARDRASFINPFTQKSLVEIESLIRSIVEGRATVVPTKDWERDEREYWAGIIDDAIDRAIKGRR